MMDERTKTAIEILPLRMKDNIGRLSPDITDNIEEIRIRAGVPVFIYLRSKELFLCDKNSNPIIATKEDTETVIKNITENSLYAYINDIKNGFVTIKGGHRIGICGTAVTHDDEIINIKDITSVNIRIAREIIGVSDEIIDSICCNGRVKNTLIISPPQAGKTTLVRDITRNLSKNKMMKIAVIDERDEIAAVYLGTPMNDVGMRTFVLSGYSKKDGFNHALRSLSPTVIICDELCAKEDAIAVKNAINRGVKIIATVHGYSIKDIEKKNEFKELLGCFESVITLVGDKLIVEDFTEA